MGKSLFSQHTALTLSRLATLAAGEENPATPGTTILLL